MCVTHPVSAVARDTNASACCQNSCKQDGIRCPFHTVTTVWYVVWAGTKRQSTKLSEKVLLFPLDSKTLRGRLRELKSSLVGRKMSRSFAYVWHVLFSLLALSTSLSCVMAIMNDTLVKLACFFCLGKSGLHMQMREAIL